MTQRQQNNEYKLIIIALVITLLAVFYMHEHMHNYQKSIISTYEEEHLTYLSSIEQAEDYKRMLDEFGELADVFPENRSIVLAIAISESNGNYNVKHPDKQTKGIGGIKPHLWTTHAKTNSLLAIEEVVEQLQAKYPNDDIYNIIRRYKGGVTNMKSTNKAYQLYLQLKNVI